MQIFIKLFLQAKMLVILINRKKLGKEMGKEVGREREIARRSSKITMQLEQFSTINVTVSQVGTRIFDKRECYHFSYISSALKIPHNIDYYRNRIRSSVSVQIVEL